MKWKIYTFNQVKSTNDVAKSYCQNTSGQYLVVQADTQISGRGRRGHVWVSLYGNLFFSIALEFNLEKCGILSLISSLSLLNVIKSLNSQADVKLKWPNDVLLNGAKVSGILLEKGPDNYIIIGIGVNIKETPKIDNGLYKTTSLAATNINVKALDFMQMYLLKFEENLCAFMENGAEFVVGRWLEYAKGLGNKIAIKNDFKEMKGIFFGLDEAGNLLLKIQDEVQTVLAGDIFILSDAND